MGSALMVTPSGSSSTSANESTPPCSTNRPLSWTTLS